MRKPVVVWVLEDTSGNLSTLPIGPLILYMEAKNLL